MKRVQTTARFLAPAALLAATLVVSVAPLRAAAPVAPKTLELGKGPVIVMVHGLGGGRMSWMPTARKLLGSYRVVLVDVPGHGDSPLPDPFSLEAAAEALDQVLARQNPDSTVLVGHGLGAMLLLQALKVHPERARGLMMIDGILKSPVKAEDSEQIKWFNRMLDERYDDFMKMLYAQAGRDSAEGLRIRAQVAQIQPATMKAYYRTIFTADVTQAYKALKAPVLYLATDRLLKNGDWATIGKQMGFDDPAAVPLRRIAGSSSLLMQDLPDSLAAVIGQFATQALAAKK